MSVSTERPLIALDAFAFPLYGRRLIEASAGTGKTYTIANLYLRLLVPTRSDVEFAYPLTVDQILVVTFTEASTSELKARIRQRIRQARQALLLGASQDVFLSQWIGQFSASEGELAVERLLNAEKQMDEAAIFTIHGFCQRMLSQNAFESRMLFQQEIETDESIPLSIAVKDVWRAETYPMTSEFAAIVRAVWSTPQALQKDLASLQSQPSVNIQGADFDIENGLKQAQERIKKVKSLWNEQATDIIALLDESDIKGTFWFNTPKKQDTREKLINAFYQWSNSDSFTLPADIKRLDASELAMQVKRNGVAPVHEIFELVSDLRANYPTTDKVKPALLSRYWQLAQKRLALWKQQTLKLTFTDLLTSLYTALHSEEGQRLAERIRQLYPIAMIDEFQDTDPVQYRIFSSIYALQQAEQQNKSALGLIMIGDPKQAIYAFRGADVYTYLAAKNDVEAVYSLATNYRSSAAMIQSVNRLFMTQPNPFQVTGIPFTPVQDRGVAGGFVRHGQVQTAMQFLRPEQNEIWSAATYEQTLAEMSASHIHELLLEGQSGQATLNTDNKIRSLAPKDIAILVSGYQQAQLMKQSLSKKGISSVYLSDRGSVFASTEAQDLWVILHAVHDEGRETSLRSALATKLLNKSHEELDLFNHDDVYFEQWSERFQHYHEVWLTQGLMPMLRRFIQDLKLASDILNRANGERSLTNLLHLGEKLQQKAMEMESQENLLRYFLMVIQSPDGNSDEQKVRLESDAELVRIITIHKSKGLEYPLVYLPFALKPFSNRDKHALFHESDISKNNPVHSPSLWFSACPNDQQKKQHEDELYATEIRLAYVALTRAKEACFIGCAEIGKAATKTLADRSYLHLSGVGSLLYAAEPKEYGALDEVLQTLSKGSIIHGTHSIDVVEKTTESLPKFKQSRENEFTECQLDQHDNPLLENRKFSAQIERDWWVGSYSSLIVGDENHKKSSLNPGLDEAALVTISEDSDLQQALLKELAVADQSDAAVLIDTVEVVENKFSFPRGAKPGTFLHDLLEGAPLADSYSRVAFADLLLAKHQSKLVDYFERQGYGQWHAVLLSWLRDILQTPLATDLPGLTLDTLSESQVFKEMEFFLPVSGFKALELDNIARRYDSVSKDAPRIQDRPLKGMLKGFIDLLFEWQGQYYVVDYKSNHLGDSEDDYHDQALREGVADHRYDLQYQLYTLALHRYLKTRIDDYDYDMHVGGVMYLFLRGMDGKSQQGIYRTKLLKEHVLEMDALFTGNQRCHGTDDLASGFTSNEEGQYDLF
ncbi:exodeoxyribonuclease V subunit beta [Marinomonas sp. 15G1-11]|uniref:RecBCD enzyme subunit RecB n=1 Tax=Marinomonas phaeophyticola TaxID=3004091 RepID=A0ABT4JNY6_9GAMM|nr:exodeoxyribonuclease V subunit beta [Marinomonas sp. 15G1-11]MCZ2720085.1 exodeoxyribonuclease V subunit beta [Marinomonas sp. 15G1-11]